MTGLIFDKLEEVDQLRGVDSRFAQDYKDS